MTIEHLLTVDEVAAILRVPRQRVYELVRSGSIPTVRLGRQVRFSRPALDRYIEKGGRALGTSGAEVLA